MLKDAHIETESGKYLWGDSLSVMEQLPDESINVVICSPPFEGDQDIRDADRLGDNFVSWFAQFFDQFERLLPPQGVVAFELGGLWLNDVSGKSVQQASFLRYLSTRGWKLLQELFYYNPQLLRPQPMNGSPRLADSVTPIWVVSRDYSGHYDIDVANKEPYKGYVRGNLLEFDTSNQYDQQYEHNLAEKGKSAYADRWPSIVPGFLIELLTKPGQTILDPFAGSGATCHAANRLGRRWIGVELNKELAHHVEAMFFDLV